MSGSSVMFSEDWMVNDCSSHYLQGQSIKRTVSEQVSTTFREICPIKPQFHFGNGVCHSAVCHRRDSQGGDAA